MHTVLSCYTLVTEKWDKL